MCSYSLGAIEVNKLSCCMDFLFMLRIGEANHLFKLVLACMNSSYNMSRFLLASNGFHFIKMGR